MAGPAIFSQQSITELTALAGRARVTYPNADKAARIIERAVKFQKGKWPPEFNTPDDEFPQALLKAHQKISEDAQYVQGALRFVELPYSTAALTRSCVELVPQVLRSVDEGLNGAWTTTTTHIDPTVTSSPDALTANVLSSIVDQETLVEGTKVNMSRVGATNTVTITAASASAGNVTFTATNSALYVYAGMSATIATGDSANNGTFPVTAVTMTSFTVSNATGVTNAGASGTATCGGGWPTAKENHRDALGREITTTYKVVSDQYDESSGFGVLTVGSSLEQWGNGQALLTTQSMESLPTLLDYRGTGGIPFGGSGFAIEETQHTTVAEGTIPAGFPSTAANVISDVIHADNLQQALRELKKIVSSAGADLDADHLPSVNVPLEVDKETKVQIYRNYKLVPNNQTLPGIGSIYPSAGNFIIDARLTPLGEAPYFSVNAIQEIEYSALPVARVEYPMVGFEFPAIFKFAPASWDTLTFYFAGFPPPWPGDGVTPGTYQLIAHRPAVRQARRTYTYTVGPSGVAATTYKVVTPGVSSRLFQIPSNCIQGPIYVYGTSAGVTYQIEAIPASTPDTYDPKDVLTIQCEEHQVLGRFFERVVTEISEDTSPYDFAPYFATLNFKASVSANISTGRFPRQALYLRSSSTSDTQNATVYGTVGSTYTKKTVALTGTSNAVSTGTQFETVFHVHLATNAVGTVHVYEKGIPPSGMIQFTAAPADGDTITIGRTGTTQVYRFKNTPAAGNDIFQSGLSVADVAKNLAYAINGDGLAGTNYFTGTSPVASVSAQVDGTDSTILHVQDSVSESADAHTYTLSNTGSAFTLTAFGSGFDGQILATINPGAADAYNTVNFYNPDLLVYSNAGQLIAVPIYFNGKQTTILEQVALPSTKPAINYNLPAFSTVVSDWLALPATPFTFTMMLLGNPALTISYETSVDAHELPSDPASPGATTLPAIGNSQIFNVQCSDTVNFVRIKINNAAAQARAIHVQLTYEVAP